MQVPRGPNLVTVLVAHAQHCPPTALPIRESEHVILQELFGSKSGPWCQNALALPQVFLHQWTKEGPLFTKPWRV